MNILDTQNKTVILYPSLFNPEDRKIFTIHGEKTFREIFNDLDINFDIDYAIFIDGDKLITDYNQYPKTDIIGIKITPAGGSGTQSQGRGMKIAGGALMAVGAVVSFFCAPVGVMIIGAGVSLMMSGYVLMNLNIPDLSDSPVSKPTISGSQNETRLTEKTPVLLGKSIMYPDNAATPYIKLNFEYDGGVQDLRQLFCAGQNRMSVDTTTYRIGDTSLDRRYYNYTLSLMQSGYTNSVYEGRMSYSAVAQAVEYGSHVTRQTPTNTKQIDVQYSYPSGLYRTSAGESVATGLAPFVEIYSAGTAPANWYAYNIRTGYTTTFTRTGTNTYNVKCMIPNAFIAASAGSHFVFYNTGSALDGQKVTVTNQISGNEFTATIISTVALAVTYYLNYRFWLAGDAFPIYWIAIPEINLWKYEIKRNYTINLDNVLPSGAHYTANRKYDVLFGYIWRDTNFRTGDIADLQLDAIRCNTGIFSGTSFESTPVNPDYDEKFTLLALSVRASESATGIINKFNFLATSVCRVWDGLGSGSSNWSNYSATQNPSAIALYCLQDAYVNPKPLSNDLIDWSSFESWYTFCNSNNFAYNFVEKGGLTLFEMLDSICLAGRASWGVFNNKVRILIEDNTSIITQLITPRNSWNLTNAKTFSDKLTGLKCTFVDETNRYNTSERIVYVDDDNPDDTNLLSADYRGITHPDHVYKIAKYQLACSLLRQNTVTLDMDIEHTLCVRGDRVALNSDVMFAGTNRGRITQLAGSSGSLSGFTSDERCIFEPLKDYSVSIRLMDGTLINKTIVNPATVANVETDVFTFETVSAANIEADCLFAVGESSNTYRDMLVVSKEMKDDFSCTLTLVDYAESVYLAGTGDIPEYDPFISIEGDYAYSDIITRDIDAKVASRLDATQTISENTYGNYLRPYFSGLVDITPSNLDSIIEYVCFDEFLYYQGNDGKVYRKNITTAASGDYFLNEYATITDNVYYISLENGVIRKIETLEPLISDYAVDTDEYYLMQSVYCRYDANTNCVYSVSAINYNLYKWDIINEVASVVAYGIKSPCFDINNDLIYYSNSSGNLVYQLLSSLGSETIYYSGVGEIYDIKYYLGLIAYLSAENSSLYLNNGISAVEYLQNISWYSVCGSNIIYTDFLQKKIYSGVVTPSPVGQKIIKTTSETVYITGDFIFGTNLVTNVSTFDIARCDAGDVIYTDFAPAGATITLKGVNQFTISENAINTGTASITIYSDRAVLNAQEALQTGSITNELFSTNLRYGYNSGSTYTITEPGNYDIMVQVSNNTGYAKYFAHIYFDTSFHSEKTLLAGTNLLTFTDLSSGVVISASSGTISVIPIK